MGLENILTRFVLNFQVAIWVQVLAFNLNLSMGTGLPIKEAMELTKNHGCNGIDEKLWLMEGSIS